MPRRLPAVCVSIAVLPVVLAAACDKAPTAPNRPTGGTTATAVRLEITGPRTVAPGGTAQFTATVHMSDGTTRDVTAEAQWRSNTVVLTLSTPGLVSTPSRGEGMLSASFNGLSSTREVIVVPDGTYRLMGNVTNMVAPAGPVPLAWVEVIAGTGQGLRSGTTDDGNYRLYGVAGDIDVRVTKAGYLPQMERLSITDHETRNIVLAPEFEPLDVSGSYTLTIAAAATCSTTLPPDAMSRQYSATLTQVGPDLTVTAGGATFGTFNSFVANVIRNGTVEPTGVRLSLGTLGCRGYYYGCGPSLLEQIAASRFFLPSGSVTLNISPTLLAGSLDGVIEVHEGPGTPNLQRVASCRSRNHRITFSR